MAPTPGTFLMSAQSNWSKPPHAVFTAGSVPERPNPPTITIQEKTLLRLADQGLAGGEVNENTNYVVQIAWDAPLDEDKVSSYDIFILTAQGSFEEDRSICNGASETVIGLRKC